jgi:hypothetical protein
VRGAPPQAAGCLLSPPVSASVRKALCPSVFSFDLRSKKPYRRKMEFISDYWQLIVFLIAFGLWIAVAVLLFPYEHYRNDTLKLPLQQKIIAWYILVTFLFSNLVEFSMFIPSIPLSQRMASMYRFAICNDIASIVIGIYFSVVSIEQSRPKSGPHQFARLLLKMSILSAIDFAVGL